MGLPTVEFLPNRVYKTPNELLALVEKVANERSSLPFAIDGLVFKVNEFSYVDQLSATAKYPRSAVAFKFSAEQVWTQLKAITVQVGRTGVLTPVAELEPVLVQGSLVSRATLHNFDEIVKKDIRLGDRLLIEKGGDVIPKVVLVDLRSRREEVLPWQIPTECPACGSKVERDTDGVAIRCVNMHCKEQCIRGLIHFASKQGLDIEGLGDKVMRQLFQKGFVKTPVDLFYMTKEMLLQLDGFKEKSAQNLLNGIENSRTTTLSRLLLALGIRHVGAQTAALLARKCGSIERFLNISKEELESINGIGEVVTASILEYIHSPEYIVLLRALARELRLISEGVTGDTPLSGKNVVVTGTLRTMSRSQAHEAIRQAGGAVLETVSKKTDFVVVGEEAGSKLLKAQKLGISLLDEAGFILALAGRGSLEEK
jgi:DNA ligase (NAD+)